MTSAEGSGPTLDEAVNAALAQLGVPRSQVTIAIIEDPAGDEAAPPGIRVRVTTREDAAHPASTNDLQHDTSAAPAVDAPEEEPLVSVDTETTTAGAEDAAEQEQIPETPEERMKRLDEEADIAADFMEGLLDLLDLPGDIEIEVTEDQAIVTVQDVGSGLLIGRRGATLDALQEVVRCAVQRSTQRRSHVRVDVEGYRARQLDKLRDKCRDAIAEVRETGQPVRLEPMDAYERKMMHDLAASASGVTSASEGNEPRRRVVIRPA